MRSTRFISAFAALVLAASLIGFVGSPAQAAKPKHEYDLSQWDTGKTKSGGFFVKGKFSTAGKKTIKLERQLPKKQRSVYKKVKANNKGKFTFTFDGPVGTTFWVVAPKTGSYKLTRVKIGTICREPCG